VPCRGRTRARARVWLEVGDDPGRWGPSVSVSEKGGGGGLGRGKEKLGRAEEEGKEELGCWVGPRSGEKRKRPAGLGCAGGKGEREKEDGLGQKRERGRKRNAFECI
jgi:hypothetical protein